MVRSKNTLEFSTEEHWVNFAKFCEYEKLSGGPDPQINMIIEMSRDAESSQERLWRALCYIAVYNVPFGEVMWRAIPWSDANLETITPWVMLVFEQKRIVTRTERRCVRRADWMIEYLGGALALVAEMPNLAAAARLAPTPEDAYELMWEQVKRYPRIGRYVAIKLLELLRRDGTLAIATPDIRPKDAWSPRKSLATLFPERGLANKDNSREALNAANAACREVVSRLSGDFNVNVDMFELQVLLCEYRESWEGRRQYPGRSVDSELGYVAKAEKLWPELGRSDIWRARLELFPQEHLGEIGGWDGPRKDVAQLLPSTGITWSDLVYDYKKSASDGKQLKLDDLERRASK